VDAVFGLLGALFGLGHAVASAVSHHKQAKAVRKSLLAEERRVEDHRQLVEEQKKKANAAVEDRKRALSDLRRSVARGRKSLMTAWGDGDDGKQTIGV
jgi:hypothetical protein